MLGRLLGTEPVAAPPDAFSLGVDGLSWARFRRGHNGFEFEGFASAPLTEDLFPSGPLGGPAVEIDALRETLGLVLAEAPGGVGAASLVLPDAWLRVAFTEIEQEARSRKQRRQVLSWKMQRLVPVRVDDLRMRAAEAPALGGNGGVRYLVLFALEALLAQLEQVFSEAGVRLGRIVPESLAAAAALETGSDGEGSTTGLVMVRREGYSLTFLRRGEPLLHRYRALADAAAADRLVLRDLKMTQTFLEEKAPGIEPSTVLLLAPEDSVMTWVQRLVEGLGRPVHALGREQLPLRGQLRHGDLEVVAPLLGAVCEEVA